MDKSHTATATTVNGSSSPVNEKISKTISKTSDGHTPVATLEGSIHESEKEISVGYFSFNLHRRTIILNLMASIRK
jgi:hypothetical protein